MFFFTSSVADIDGVRIVKENCLTAGNRVYGVNQGISLVQELWSKSPQELVR